MSDYTREIRRESYEAITAKRANRRALILELLGDRQMTASELTWELLAKGYIKYYDRNFVAPRLTELKEAGLVMTVGKRMCALAKMSPCGPGGRQNERDTTGRRFCHSRGHPA